MRITESKKVRLELELCIFEFRTPGDAHFYPTNIVEFRTPFSLFFRYAPLYLPRLNAFGFVSQMGPSPFVRIFRYHGLRCGFSTSFKSEYYHISIAYCIYVFWNVCYEISITNINSTTIVSSTRKPTLRK